MTASELSIFRKEWESELENILKFWHDHVPDPVHGGFLGGLDNDNRLIPDAPKGSVLHARILWTFSMASRFHDHGYILETADRAFRYIRDRFLDPDHGGVYWSLTPDGSQVLDSRKQVYAQAFTLYGLSAYHAAKQDAESLSMAIDLYNLIEEHSFDPGENGYFEAFSRDWGPLSDLRLSAKDANEKKTANTHLHIIEAYAQLYQVWPDSRLHERMLNLLELFSGHFIHPESHHLLLFFNEHWQVKPDVVSYGHDIEAAWLLQQCAETTGDEKWMAVFSTYAPDISVAALEGMDADGGLWYEFDTHKGEMIREKHWWPQAEAMVGFWNAWQLTGKEEWRSRSVRSWAFVKANLLDRDKGEWFWGVTEDGKPMRGQDKAGFWKCPYHNGRAFMELLQRTR